MNILEKAKLLNFLVLNIVIFISCDLFIESEVYEDKKDSGSSEVTINNMEVPEDFDYAMTNDFNKVFTLNGPSGEPLAGVAIDVYSAKPSEGGRKLSTVVTDENGNYEVKLNLPSHQNSIYLAVNYVGILNEFEVFISEELNLKSSNENLGVDSGIRFSLSYGTLEDTFSYIGTFDRFGKPDYLIERDTIDNDFLADINASLPEGRPVPEYHPTYIASGTESNSALLEEADVWVTFVHEGAGYKNALGYYIYDRNNPPASLSDIEEFYIVFPNVSYSGSGGSLQSGDKVFLGRFPKDTVIGYFLIANSWRNGTNTTGNNIFYSNSEFNAEESEVLRQHNVLLWDEERKKLLLGFEDINRERSGCDNDFNDAIFYLSINPPEAVDTTGIEPIDTDTPVDTDGDGVTDLYDDYPDDPLKAFNNYYPAQGQYGTLAFEDMWPKKGDYDFNDLCIEYNYVYVTNRNLEVVEITCDFRVNAIGAGYHNGFGFELPVLKEHIEFVEGLTLNDSIVSLEANNTESNHDNAVIIVVDNVNRLFNKGGSMFVNTEDDAPVFEPVSMNVEIRFSTPAPLSSLGFPPYNPFVIINKNRGHEVHLPGKMPTLLADDLLFGLNDDDTNFSVNKYYKTDHNLPWALNIPDTWDHMKEEEAIDKGYKNFVSWATSGGRSYSDWYVDKAEYRDIGKIYRK